MQGISAAICSPRPACGERHRPPTAAVKRNAEGELRLCCGAIRVRGVLHRFRSWRVPLIPTFPERALLVSTPQAGRTKKVQGGNMSRIAMAAAAATLLMASQPADAAEPINLRGMGSFHVGGRTVEITRQARARGAAGRRAACRPRSIRTAFTRSSTCTCSSSSADPQGQGAAADVARRRAHWRDLRDHARRPRRLAQMFIRKGWDVYNSDAVERGRSGFASPDVWQSSPTS